MCMVGIIYYLKNQITEKGYVGQTTCELRKRLNEHKTTAIATNKKKKTYLHRAIAKYGWDAFDISIIEENISAVDLDERETFWISSLGTKQPTGYNLTDGGRTTRGRITSEETRQKIRDKRKLRVGWHHSQETKQKISQAQEGRIFSEETKEKMRKNHADVSGENNPMFGSRRNTEVFNG